jgi:hypothetical protein
MRAAAHLTYTAPPSLARCGAEKAWHQLKYGEEERLEKDVEPQSSDIQLARHNTIAMPLGLGVLSSIRNSV